MPRLIALLLIAGSPLALTHALARPVDAQLTAPAPRAERDLAPIRKITLYRSGVGYFERNGSIEGDAELHLRFSTDQINDILKSMVLLDLGGGRIETVSYGSKEPLSRRLASFGVDISDNPSIPVLLQQLRGAHVRITAAGETLSGAILGVEERAVQSTKDGEPYMATFVNIVAQDGAGGGAGALRSVAIASVSSFEILDQELGAELNKALATLAEYRADRTKTVDIRFAASGKSGPRDVVVGYIHEMPVWKPSYRLILPDEGAAKGDKKRTVSLQGWAIVENNTDQDWENVRLSLVSGRPVSFQMDLYEPLYVFRPTIPVPTVPGVAPRAYQGGQESVSWFDARTASLMDVPQIELRSLNRKAGRPGEARGGSGQSPFSGDQDMGVDRFKDINASDMADYAAAAQASAGEVGEVFQYELDAPVTIARQRSAMLPILTASISGRRVSIFNPADGADHPMRGVEVTNDSDLQLLPGPISVFDGNDNRSTYAGDAQIGHVPAGDKRLLAYAVDLDVDVLTRPESASNVTKVRIVDGVYEQTSRVRETAAYAFENKDARRARTIVVEQPRLKDYELTTPEKAAETTQDFYRFELALDPGKTGTLAVIQERTVRQQVGIVNGYDLPTLLRLQRDGRVSAAVIDAFKQVASRQAAIGEAERRLAEVDRQLAEIGKDQSRIRENMGQIDRTSQLYTRYMTKLSEQETQLETLTATRQAQQAQIEQLRKDFDAFVRSLNIE